MESPGRGVRSLEAGRKQLQQTNDGATLALADTERQVQAYQESNRRGLVSALDLAVVGGARTEASVTVDLNRLDWQAWDLDRRALFETPITEGQRER